MEFTRKILTVAAVTIVGYPIDMYLFVWMSSLFTFLIYYIKPWRDSVHVKLNMLSMGTVSICGHIAYVFPVVSEGPVTILAEFVMIAIILGAVLYFLYYLFIVPARAVRAARKFAAIERDDDGGAKRVKEWQRNVVDERKKRHKKFQDDVAESQHVAQATRADVAVSSPLVASPAHHGERLQLSTVDVEEQRTKSLYGRGWKAIVDPTLDRSGVLVPPEREADSIGDGDNISPMMYDRGDTTPNKPPPPPAFLTFKESAVGSSVELSSKSGSPANSNPRGGPPVLPRTESSGLVDSDDVLGLNKIPDDDLLGWGDNDREGLPPDDIDWDENEEGHHYFDEDEENLEDELYYDDEEHFEDYEDNYDDYDEGVSYNSDLGIGGASANSAQPPTATRNAADSHLDRMLQAVRERRGTVFVGAATGVTRPPQRPQAVEQLLRGHQDDPYQASRRL